MTTPATLPPMPLDPASFAAGVAACRAFLAVQGHHVQAELLAYVVPPPDFPPAPAEPYSWSAYDVARSVGCSVQAVGHNARAGKLPAQLEGGAYRFRPSEVQAWTPTRMGSNPPAMLLRVGKAGGLGVKVRVWRDEYDATGETEWEAGPEATEQAEVTDWTAIEVLTIAPDSRRYFRLEPGKVHRAMQWGPGRIEGRYEVVEKVNNARAAGTRWEGEHGR